MLAYLNGLVKERKNGETILAVGSEAQGFVGYLVKTPDHPRYDSLIPGQRAEIYLYTHVREDALDLYGFLSASEKLVYTTLLSVSGVGPKMALALLSFTEPSTLVQMILDEDKAALTNISGVGKKTAERIILELKDTFRKKMEANLIHSDAAKNPGVQKVNRASELFIESYLALQALGYKEAQAKLMVEKSLNQGSFNKVEDVVKTALQMVMS